MSPARRIVEFLSFVIFMASMAMLLVVGTAMQGAIP